MRLISRYSVSVELAGSQAAFALQQRYSAAADLNGWQGDLKIGSRRSVSVDLSRWHGTLNLLGSSRYLQVDLARFFVGPKGDPGDQTYPATHARSMGYAGGLLTTVECSDGSTKTLIYEFGRLAQIDFARPGQPTVRKVLSYSPEGLLASVSQSEV